MTSSRGHSRAVRRGGAPRSLTEDQIVDVALAITRAEGLDGLTMTALADRLGVGVMTLYSYFRGRDELLDAMAHRAAVELYDHHEDITGATWDVELLVHYKAIRSSLKRHPALADLLFYRGQVLPAGGPEFDEIASHVRRHVEAMVAGGVAPASAVRAFLGLSMFTLASTLRDDDREAVSGNRERIDDLVKSVSATLPDSVGGDVRFGSDEQFEAMLAFVIRGIEATIGEAPIDLG
jgi:AcrR family transcriptional regulator